MLRLLRLLRELCLLQRGDQLAHDSEPTLQSLKCLQRWTSTRMPARLLRVLRLLRLLRELCLTPYARPSLCRCVGDAFTEDDEGLVRLSTTGQAPRRLDQRICVKSAW